MDGQTFWQMIFVLSQPAVFFWIFAMGAGFTLIFFIFGELFDGVEDVFHGALDALHLDTIFDLDTDGGPSAFSPRVLSVFVAVFGGAGFISSLQKIGPVASSLIGIGCGIVIASVFFLIFRWVHRQQSSSGMSNYQLIGKFGTIKTGIPNNGVGEVVVDYVGSRQTRSAKSIDGAPINTNANVVVKEVRGEILIVEAEK